MNLEMVYNVINYHYMSQKLQSDVFVLRGKPCCPALLLLCCRWPEVGLGLNYRPGSYLGSQCHCGAAAVITVMHVVRSRGSLNIAGLVVARQLNERCTHTAEAHTCLQRPEETLQNMSVRELDPQHHLEHKHGVNTLGHKLYTRGREPLASKSLY